MSQRPRLVHLGILRRFHLARVRYGLLLLWFGKGVKVAGQVWAYSFGCTWSLASNSAKTQLTAATVLIVVRCQRLRISVDGWIGKYTFRPAQAAGTAGRLPTGHQNEGFDCFLLPSLPMYVSPSGVQ